MTRRDSASARGWTCQRASSSRKAAGEHGVQGVLVVGAQLPRVVRDVAQRRSQTRSRRHPLTFTTIIAPVK